MRAIVIITVAGSLAPGAQAGLAFERVEPMVRFSDRSYSDLWQLGRTALVFDQPDAARAVLTTGSLIETAGEAQAPLDFEEPVQLSSFRDENTIYIPGPGAGALIGTGTVLLTARRR
ncbi:MAG: hypothetical protein AAGG07_09610 [Planctomycetota bacterium]